MGLPPVDGESECFLELGVEVVGLARDVDVGPELFLDLLEFCQGVGEALLGASHADVLPHDVSEFLVDGVDGALALDAHDLGNLVLDGLLGSVELRCRSVCLRFGELV